VRNLARRAPISGWLLGERYLLNRAAVIDAAVEKGRVVLLGFRTEHRGQPLECCSRQRP
jgi:hypothetical protein